jgi:arylsulfatase A-like enzyme
VPAVIEWPARITTHRVIDEPCGTVDIYPTLLELAGVDAAPHQPPLDGASLVPLLAGAAWERPDPLGFWVYPAGGRRTPSREWMMEMQRMQQAGESPTAAQLDAAAGEIGVRDRADALPGHSAWIDGAVKLHRIPAESGELRYELYNLVEDPAEERDLAAEQADRVQELAAELEAWQRSLVRSLKGDDYGSGTAGK